jgi:hypothetical protein
MSSTYAQFIAANEALFKCMESVSNDSFQALSAADQGAVCKVEGDAVAGFINNNSVTFRSLINERLDNLSKQQ